MSSVMLYTIFGILMILPLVVLAGSIGRTAVSMTRDVVVEQPVVEPVRAKASPAPAVKAVAVAHPRLGGHARRPMPDNVVALPVARHAAPSDLALHSASSRM